MAVSVALLLAPRIALADDDDGRPKTTPHPVAAQVDESTLERLAPHFAGAFVLGVGQIQSVPSAVPQRKVDYAFTSVFGAGVEGRVFDTWGYTAIVTANTNTNLDGTNGGFAPELIKFEWHPHDRIWVDGGYIRIPFSVGQSTIISSSMFPTRPQPTELFQGGADAGLLARYESDEGKVRVRAGVFDGLSLRTQVPDYTTRGPVVSLSTEFSPLGGMPGLQGDYKHSEFRFALAAGGIYRRGTAFDPTGYAGLGVQDIGVALAARIWFKGFYLQAEYLRDYRTDDLSGRPKLTQGAYAETSYHVIANRRGISPMARLGWSEADGQFFPLHVITGNAGIAFFPRADLDDRGRVRFILAYQTERRVEESESAYGVIGSILYGFR